MSDSIQSIAEKIKRLEIQGARNVAITAIKALEKLAFRTEAKNKKELLNEFLKAKEILFATRETEPFMRNAIRWVISCLEKSREENINRLVKTIKSSSRFFRKFLEESKEKIAEIGAKRIKDDSVILTHCHSSTVNFLLKKAKEEGKSFEVICTETRPIFQGRKTAKEMLELGLKTTFIIDSAARFFMNKVDMVMVGADAITSEGNIINKIGTSMIALAAHEARTPFYVVTELLKFDPATMYGDYEKIEERSSDEIWKKPPEKLIIRNPAFDVTRRDFIHGIICEEGIISPHSIIEVIHRRYPWIFSEFNL
ncbi:MAG: S-methyl-5-thioribose-1-phosphate isomerase [Nitrososphaerales archaeon]